MASRADTAVSAVQYTFSSSRCCGVSAVVDGSSRLDDVVFFCPFRLLVVTATVVVGLHVVLPLCIPCVACTAVQQ